MSAELRRARGPARLVWLGLLALAAGCSAPVDYELAPPPSWRPTALAGLKVPGKPLAAWTGPHGALLVAYTTLPVPGGAARGLAADQAHRLANMPDMQVVVERTERLSGLEAARIELVAPGTGDALAPTGTGKPVAPKGEALVPTRRVAVGFPRSSDTFWLTWFYPETYQPELAPQVEAALKSLKLHAGS